MKKTIELVTRQLDPTTDIACVDVLTNVGHEARPQIIPFDKCEGTCTSGVTCKDKIVTGMKNVSMEGEWNKKTVIMKDKVTLKPELSVVLSKSILPLRVIMNGGLIMLCKA